MLSFISSFFLLYELIYTDTPDIVCINEAVELAKIYSDDDVARIKELREMTGAKIMAGIMPLVSRKNAMFIANEMPGMNVPDYIVEKYKADMTREESEQVAIDISVEIAKKLHDCCDGYYFMTPFNRVNLICNVIEKIRSGLNL